MFGVGWTEMLVIGVVALVVIGPKDLPIVMQRLGKFVASVRRMGTEFQQELNKTTGLDQLSDLRRSITEPLRQTSADIAREFNAMTTTGPQPSGAIKPEDPNVESVYSAINSAAGMESGEKPEGEKAAKTGKPARKTAARRPRKKAAAKPDAVAANGQSGEPAAVEAKPKAAPRSPRRKAGVAKANGAAATGVEAAAARKPAARKSTAASTRRSSRKTPAEKTPAPPADTAPGAPQEKA